MRAKKAITNPEAIKEKNRNNTHRIYSTLFLKIIPLFALTTPAASPSLSLSLSVPIPPSSSFFPPKPSGLVSLMVEEEGFRTGEEAEAEGERRLEKRVSSDAEADAEEAEMAAGTVIVAIEVKG